MLAGLATVSATALALVVALIKSMRSKNGNGLTAAQTAILAELKLMNGSLGRIEGHQEAFAASQARTAEALAYWKGRMDGTPA